jgi:flagellar motor switch protein FliN/FliY
VQLVPNAFIVRIARALDELEAEVISAASDTGAGLGSASIREIPVRFSAELGRARMVVGRAVRLATGAVVQLDRTADEPIDIYVNGRRFARGALVLNPVGDWAVRIDELLADTAELAA